MWLRLLACPNLEYRRSQPKDLERFRLFPRCRASPFAGSRRYGCPSRRWAATLTMWRACQACPIDFRHGACETVLFDLADLPVRYIGSGMDGRRADRPAECWRTCLPRPSRPHSAAGAVVRIGRAGCGSIPARQHWWRSRRLWCPTARRRQPQGLGSFEWAPHAERGWQVSE